MHTLPRCLFLFTLLTGSWAQAHSPVDFLLASEVEPGNPINHAVELKSRLDEDKVATNLTGPSMLFRAVGGMGRPQKKRLAFLTGYKIANPKEEPLREIKVLDIVRGSSNKSLKIQSAEHVLCPAQMITSGPPQDVPDGLDHYKAYRVVEPPAVDMPITLADGSEEQSRSIRKPLYVCLPVRQWHHEEFVSATHPNDGFVIYQLDKQAGEKTFTTIDQFGLNELKASASQYLCVRATILRN